MPKKLKRGDKRYTLTFADLVSSQYDPQEKLIQEYQDSLVYEDVKDSEPVIVEPVGEALNKPYLNSEGALCWVAVAEEDPEFESSYYFVGSAVVDRKHRVNINIKLKNEKVGKKLAMEYIVKNDLGIDLEDYLSAKKLVA